MAVYLITGVAGFIGWSLAWELLRREQVRGVNNFSPSEAARDANVKRVIYAAASSV